MKYLYLNRVILVLIFLLVSVGAVPHAGAQDVEKSLSIERYGDEPLELVGLKIGSQSFTNKIPVNARDNPVRADTINFKERDGWFRHLQVTLRNISGKPIYGVRSHLFFRPSYTRTIYSLPLTAFTKLGQGILEPGAEITLTVTDEAWNVTAAILKHNDVDPDRALVSFGVDVVLLSDNLQWSKGQMLRRDPNNPNRWIVH